MRDLLAVEHTSSGREGVKLKKKKIYVSLSATTGRTGRKVYQVDLIRKGWEVKDEMNRNGRESRGKARKIIQTLSFYIHTLSSRKPFYAPCRPVDVLTVKTRQVYVPRNLQGVKFYVYRIYRCVCVCLPCKRVSNIMCRNVTNLWRFFIASAPGFLV